MQLPGKRRADDRQPPKQKGEGLPSAPELPNCSLCSLEEGCKTPLWRGGGPVSTQTNFLQPPPQVACPMRTLSCRQDPNHRPSFSPNILQLVTMPLPFGK